MIFKAVFMNWKMLKDKTEAARCELPLPDGLVGGKRSDHPNGGTGADVHDFDFSVLLSAVGLVSLDHGLGECPGDNTFGSTGRGVYDFGSAAFNFGCV